MSIMPSPTSYDPAQYSLEMEKLRRRRALAQALAQGGQMPQGQMVGRHFVAPHPLQQLAAVGQQLAGAYIERKANQKEDTLRTGRQKQISDILRQYADPGMSSTVGKSETPDISTRDASMASAVRGDPTMQFIESLPLEQQEAIIRQKAIERLFPKPKESPFGKIDPKDYTKESIAKFQASGDPADLMPRTKYEVSGGEAYDPYTVKPGQKVGTVQGGTTVNVNTEKNLYGTMADAQGKANVELYEQAQKAPELLNRAQRVKQLLGPNNEAITGAGANWLLAGAKVANQFGFNTGDAAADTEMLARELGAATLDAIKASGLGAGSGFSNADRDFLEKVVGGKIDMEANTLKRLADLNEKSAMATIQKWNATATRLDPKQLQTLGMAPIEMPAGAPAPGAKPKLTRNPDGSYNYSP